jgi:hypothetical protein
MALLTKFPFCMVWQKSWLFLPKNHVPFLHLNLQKGIKTEEGKRENIEDSQGHSLLPHSCYPERKQCVFLDGSCCGMDLNFDLLAGCDGLVMR